MENKKIRVGMNETKTTMNYTRSTAKQTWFEFYSCIDLGGRDMQLGWQKKEALRSLI